MSWPVWDWLLLMTAVLAVFAFALRWFQNARKEASIIAWLAPAIIEAPIFFELINVSHEKSHFMDRHGPMLSRFDVLQRAKTGSLDVAGLKGRPVTSARWLRQTDLLQAVLSAAEHWRDGERPNGGRFMFEFKETIGEGYLKGKEALINTNVAVVIIRKDYVLTAFPLLSPPATGQQTHSLQRVSEPRC